MFYTRVRCPMTLPYVERRTCNGFSGNKAPIAPQSCPLSGRCKHFTNIQQHHGLIHSSLSTVKLHLDLRVSVSAPSRMIIVLPFGRVDLFAAPILLVVFAFIASLALADQLQLIR